ncbi:hypothetical protein [Bacillus sp. JJ722]|uniref:hypothetical protein n=1 Tax=Bacillus sp. JJ722 TaxID=3122973 RepID=UPI002FFFE0FC
MLQLYLKGYVITEICEVKDITKQRVSIIIGKERERLGISPEDAKQQNREARKKLQKLSAWYAGVYRADEEGDLEPVLDTIDKPKMATLSVMYQTYQKLGGTKIKMSDADVDRCRWNPEEDKTGAVAVRMYMEGHGGRAIRAKLAISREELFMHYRRYLRLKAEKAAEAKVTSSAVLPTESSEETQIRGL